MDPQLEHGHTRIANELLEHLAAHLAGCGAQLAVMLLVMRFSYGYNRKHADFTVTELAAMLDLDRSNTRRAIRSLEAKAMLTIEDRPGHRRKRYSIRKRWREWSK